MEDIESWKDIPLTEECNNSPDYPLFLHSPYFHHSDKGCKIKMSIKRVEGDEDRVAITKTCLTHNCECSKTGWKLGWFMGTESREHRDQKKCQRCGCTVETNAVNFKYCKECQRLEGIKRCQARKAKLYESKPKTQRYTLDRIHRNNPIMVGGANNIL